MTQWATRWMSWVVLTVARLVGERLVVQVAASLEAADMLEGDTLVVA